MYVLLPFLPTNSSPPTAEYIRYTKPFAIYYVYTRLYVAPIGVSLILLTYDNNALRLVDPAAYTLLSCTFRLIE